MWYYMHRTTETVNAVFQPMAHVGEDGWQAQAEVFWEVFSIFAGVGTLVGVVVVSYMMYNAYKYRDAEGTPGEVESIELGELPRDAMSKKSKKLFLSLAISAVVVIVLVVYAYTALLYVEAGPDVEEDAEMHVHVEGYQFGWDFEYENGHVEAGTMRVPEDTVVRLTVTSRDVWHNFGISELKIKVDSIPGQTGETWIAAEEGEYLIECFELCGDAHSQMVADLVVMEEDEFEEWYEGTNPEEETEEAEQ